ncbi:TPA: type I toxin-antitoxin system Ibs family toxin, partial [Escherichia coli]
FVIILIVLLLVSFQAY